MVRFLVGADESQKEDEVSDRNLSNHGVLNVVRFLVGADESQKEVEVSAQTADPWFGLVDDRR